MHGFSRHAGGQRVTAIGWDKAWLLEILTKLVERSQENEIAGELKQGGMDVGPAFVAHVVGGSSAGWPTAAPPPSGGDPAARTTRYRGERCAEPYR